VTALKANVKELNAILRGDMHAMLHKVATTLMPAASFRPNWHHEAITYALQQCLDGRIKRLIITLPPRSLKSITASVAFPLFALAQDPQRQIICVSYNEDFSKSLAQQRSRILQADWFQHAFGHLVSGIVLPTREMDIVTKANGGIFTTSVAGTMTGRGGDFIVIDDPVKASDINSEAERERVASWYRETLVTRLNDKKTGVIILIMQRLHVDDLVGQVLPLDDWHHLNLPAIAQKDTIIPIGDLDQAEWPAGVPLHEEREGLAELETIRRSMGSYLFQAQYLQDPVPAEGNLVKRSWIARYNGTLTAKDFDFVLHSWDTAIGLRDTNDYSVCTVWGKRDNKVYLLDVWRGRADFPTLARQVHRLAERDDPNKIVIEAAAGGQSLIQYLRSNSSLPIVKMTPKGDKQARLEGVSAYFEGGRVLLPKEAGWLAAYETELCGFPGAAHDDQVDSTTQALLVLTRPGPPVFVLHSYPSFSTTHGTVDRYFERTGGRLF
jgi:predicted phage terminase large subunit-like protein